MESRSRRDVRLRVNDAPLEGRLTVPDSATGLVVLVNGGWGVQYASRESKLAVALRRRGFGTLTVGLLTPREDRDRASRFATASQAGRLDGVTDWLDYHDRTAALPRGLLGVGPGAATALRAVERFETGVGAVVGLDGVFDDCIEEVDVPTLLVLGRRPDRPACSDQQVRRRLDGDNHEIVLARPEDGSRRVAPRRVDPLAGDWFERHLTQS